MDAAALGRRFLESTRGRVLALLRRGERTVEELAQALGLTDNAVRSHLASLERDGLVRAEGVRRSGGAGKPAVLYGVHPDAVPLLSRAYPPVLSTLLDVIVDELAPDRREEVMREVGRRLAARVGGRSAGDLEQRVRTAVSVLESLGGDVELLTESGGVKLQGAACPLSAVVCHRPEVCLTVEAMLSEIIGAPAQSCCSHGERPRCCFEIGSAA